MLYKCIYDTYVDVYGHAPSLAAKGGTFGGSIHPSLSASLLSDQLLNSVFLMHV